MGGDEIPFVCEYGTGVDEPCVSMSLDPPRIGVLSSSFFSLASRALRSSLSLFSVSIDAACWLTKLIMKGIVKSCSPWRHDSSITT